MGTPVKIAFDLRGGLTNIEQMKKLRPLADADMVTVDGYDYANLLKHDTEVQV